MKRAFPPLLALFVSTSALLAGSFGPGPWANGAYYPGQFDGKYSAAMFGTNVSGVLAFGLSGGTFTTATNSTVTTENSTQSTISVNPLQNYFLAFIEGRTYAGFCIGSVNNDANSVAGSLFDGQGPVTVVAFTNTTVTFNTNTPPTVASSNNTVTFEERQNTASGGFTANITSDKAVVAFVGMNTGTLAESFNGIPFRTNRFSLNGLKTSDDTSTGSSGTSTTGQ